jgi:hypothetical protein
MRSPQERNTRLENMTWRIWNLARKKKEVSAVLSRLFFSPWAVLVLVQSIVRRWMELVATILPTGW